MSELLTLTMDSTVGLGAKFISVYLGTYMRTLLLSKGCDSYFVPDVTGFQ